MVPLWGEVLGPVRLVAGGEVVEVGGPRQRRLLGALLIDRGSIVSTDQLIEAVFEGAPPDAAQRTFRTYVARLRRALEVSGIDAATVIETGPSGYGIPHAAVELDADRFESALTDGQSRLEVGDPDGALACLDEALALWSGPAYGEFAGEHWAMAEANRLDELHEVARELRLEALMESGRHVSAIPDLESLVDAAPFRERPRRLLMVALYRSGRHADALRAGRAYRDFLAEETGLEPSREFAELERLIIEQDPRLDARPRGRRLRGYLLGSPIAETELGITYLATQPSVGRDVAVTAIPSELADDPAFVRRFEVHAQRIASIEHPNVVPLYDYWREPGAAYLVTRYLAGGSLATQLAARQLSDDECTAVIRDVASALAVAHERGVAHGRLTATRVLFDERGTAYLTGFGLDVDRREAQADIADLGRLAVEVWDSSAAAADVRDVVSAQLRVVAGRARGEADAPPFGSVSELVDAIEAVTSNRTTGAQGRPSVIPTAAIEGPNPYRGLFAFSETDAAVFFGREQLVDDMLAALDVHPFLAVIGPSGSGKSSVVRAGLLPRLRASGTLVATMVPGRRPLAEFGVALSRVASTEVPDLAAVLEAAAVESGGASEFSETVRNLLPAPDDGLVVLIDQFEEMFTDADTRERDLLLSALAGTFVEGRRWLSVVVTARADFLGPILDHPTIGAFVRDRAQLITPLDVEQMHAAIARPAESAGVAVEPSLASALVADAAASPGPLPLLQYALTELYERRVDGTMTLDAYRHLGGMAAILSQRAEEIYSNLDADDRATSRRLFSRLVTPGEGAGDTRRRARRSELPGVSDDLLERYGSARLIAFDRDPDSREPTVEVAHEALLREWPRLGGWIDGDRDGLRLLRHLGSAAREWEASGRDRSELYRGPRLSAADEWDRAHPGELSPGEQRFLDASRTERDAAAAAERRRIRRLRALLAAVTIVALIAATAGVIAIGQRSTAVRNAHDLDLRRLIAESQNAIEVDSSRALLLAVEAHRIDPSSETLGALQTVIARTPHDWIGDIVTGRAYRRAAILSDDRIAAAGDHGVEVWDPATLEMLHELPLGAPVTDLDVSSDGERLAVGAADGTWYVLESAGLAPIASGRAGAGVAAIRIDTANDVLVIGRTDGRVEVTRVSEPDHGRALSAFDVHGDLVTSPVTDVDVSGDGRRLAAAWGAGHAAQQWTLADEGDTVQMVDPDLDATHVLYAHDVLYIGTNPVQAFDPVSLEPVGQAVTGLGPTTVDAALIAVGPQRLIEIGNNHLTEIDLATASVTSSRPYESGAVLGGGAISPDGRTALFATPYGLVLWALDGAGAFVDTVVPAPSEPGEINAITADGRVAIQSGHIRDQVPARIWDVSSPTPAMLLETERGRALRVHGTDVFEFGRSETDDALAFRVWNPATNVFEPLIDASFDTFGVNIPLITPDGRWFVHPWNNGQGIIDVYDVGTGEHVAHLTDIEAASPPFTTLAGVPTLTPDRQRLVTPTKNRYVAVYDTATWRLLDLLEPAEGFSEIAFTPDGEHAVTHSNRGLELRSADDLRDVRLGPVPGEDSVADGTTLEITEDGRYVKTAGTQGPRLWDAATLAPIGGRFPHDPGTWAATLATSTNQLATVVDGEVVVWNVDVAAWPELACRAAGRNLTRDEWDQFGPAGEYRSTCDRWPTG